MLQSVHDEFIGEIIKMRAIAAVRENRNRNTFQEILNVHTKTALTQHPFNSDYATLNQIAFHTNKKAQIEAALRDSGITSEQRITFQETLNHIDSKLNELKETFLIVFIKSEYHYLLQEKKRIEDLCKDPATTPEKLKVEKRLAELKGGFSHHFLQKKYNTLLNEKKRQKNKLREFFKEIKSVEASLSIIDSELAQFEQNIKNEGMTLDTLDEDFAKYFSNLKDKKASREEELRYFSKEIKSVEASLSIIDSQLTQLEQHNTERHPTSSNKFITDTLSELEEKYNDICKNDSSETKWQKAMLKHYRAKNRYIPRTPDRFISHLLTNSKKYLPRIYGKSDDALSTAAIRFPSSANGDHANVFVHADHGIEEGSVLLAASAPIKVINKQQNKIILDYYLEMLEFYHVDHIICLGNSPTRLDYKNVASAKFTTKHNKDGLKLKNHVTNESKRIGYSAFAVNDNNSLNLTNDDLAKLLCVYDIYRTKTVLAHCDSGVGRTGQIRLLFALLDQHKVDPRFQMAYNQTIDLLSLASPTDEQQDAFKRFTRIIFDGMSEELCRLRRTRYCVQTEGQFAGTFSQLLLLISAQKGYSHEQLNELRHILIPLEKATADLTERDDAAVNDPEVSMVAPSLAITLFKDSPGSQPSLPRLRGVAFFDLGGDTQKLKTPERSESESESEPDSDSDSDSDDDRRTPAAVGM